ncbi:hypothetical protein [Jannaschia seohaensis]|uniref:hypothetical protein n=1 Tax=Jannaschia seohaensis TaxID=475081 RepID=UPI0011B260F5|nr:hypothetical protein [Jannaschia seohaensis]
MSATRRIAIKRRRARPSKTVREANSFRRLPSGRTIAGLAREEFGNGAGRLGQQQPAAETVEIRETRDMGEAERRSDNGGLDGQGAIRAMREADA